MPTQIGLSAAEVSGEAAAPEKKSSPEVPEPEDSADDSAWDAGDTTTAPTEAKTAAPSAPPTPPPPVVAPSPPPTPVVNAPVPTPTPTPVGVPRKMMPSARDAEQTSPQPTLTMSTAMREEVWAIVRAAVNDAIAPVVARNKDLEQRLLNAERNLERERAERERLVEQAKEAVAAASLRPAPAPAPAAVTTRPAGNSIPVSLDPSIPPAAPVAGPPGIPDVFLEGPKLSAAPRTAPVAKMPQKVPGGSIPPTGLGVVVTAGPSPTLDLSRASVGVIEVPDFGRRRRMMGRLLVVLMIVLVVGAIVMTALSYS